MKDYRELREQAELVQADLEILRKRLENGGYAVGVKSVLSRDISESWYRIQDVIRTCDDQTAAVAV
jgi:hypothetical protein